MTDEGQTLQLTREGAELLPWDQPLVAGKAGVGSESEQSSSGNCSSSSLSVEAGEANTVLTEQSSTAPALN